MRKPATIIFGVVCVVFAFLSFCVAPTPDSHKKLAIAAWFLLPPLYFWLEFYLYWDRRWESLGTSEREKFKMYQELSRNLWAAIGAALAVAYFSGK
jgi:hypothetical protein